MWWLGLSVYGGGRLREMHDFVRVYFPAWRSLTPSTSVDSSPMDSVVKCTPVWILTKSMWRRPAGVPSAFTALSISKLLTLAPVPSALLPVPSFGLKLSA